MVDGSSSQAIFPFMTAMQQESICLELPVLHMHSLELLSAIIKSARRWTIIFFLLGRWTIILTCTIYVYWWKPVRDPFSVQASKNIIIWVLCDKMLPASFFRYLVTVPLSIWFIWWIMATFTWTKEVTWNKSTSGITLFQKGCWFDILVPKDFILTLFLR